MKLLIIVVLGISVGILAKLLLDYRKTSSTEEEQIPKEQPSKQKEIVIHCPFSNGANVINEKGETVGVVTAKSALLLNFLLNHPNKEMSTYELGPAIGLNPSTVLGASIALRKHEWIVYKQDTSDYYNKIVLTEKGKKLFLQSL